MMTEETLLKVIEIYATTDTGEGFTAQLRELFKLPPAMEVKCVGVPCDGGEVLVAPDKVEGDYIYVDLPKHKYELIEVRGVKILKWHGHTREQVIKDILSEYNGL